jgi:hypothetical protein
MQDRFVVAVIVLLAFVFVGRLVSEAGLKKLEPNEKAALLDSQAGLRKYSLPAVAVLILIAVRWPSYGFWLVGAYALVLLALSYRLVARASIPRSYMRSFAIHHGLYIVGLGAYLWLLRVP